MSDNDWKFNYVKRRLYDSYVDRTGKRIAQLITDVSQLRNEVLQLQRIVQNIMIPLESHDLKDETKYRYVIKE